MLGLSEYSLMAGAILVALALACHMAALAMRRTARQPMPAGRRPVLAYASARGGSGAGGGVDTGETAEDWALTEPDVTTTGSYSLAWYGSRLAQMGLVLLTLSLAARTLATGHGPFANQYEFAVSFAWGMIAAYAYFEWRYRVRLLSLLVLPISLAMLLYAMTVGSEAAPLVPALQNNLLLTLHVVTAILAYGANGVAFAAAALYLAQPDGGRRGLPRPALLDEIGYRAVVVSFPLMTLMIILGAVWADIAWGQYWSWDPKETASLVTWLIYGAYLHARVVRDWRGRRAAWLLVLGFAAVMFTYFGNLFFGGLHTYG